MSDKPTSTTGNYKVDDLSVATVASQDPANVTKMKTDVDTLIQKLNGTIRSGFKDAGDALKIVDKAIGPDGKPLNDTGKPFYPQWEALSNQFEHLLISSLEVSGFLSGQCLGFENAVLNFVANPGPLTPDELLSLVDAFTKGLDEHKSQLEDFRHGFQLLIFQLLALARVIEDLAVRKLDGVKNKLPALHGNIRAAELEIDRIKRGLEFTTIDIDGTVSVITDVLDFLPSYTGVLGSAAFPARASAIGVLKNETASQQDVIDAENVKIADLSSSIEVLQHAQTEMNVIISTNIWKANDALMSFSNVLRTLTRDGASIQVYLQNPSKIKYPPPVLAVYSEQKFSIYKPLSDAIIRYARFHSDEATGANIKFEPNVVEQKLSNLVEMGRIHPVVDAAVQDVLKRVYLHV